jgi:hypothetical protein
VEGRLQEARVAVSSDQDIAELGRELGPAGVDGEIDVEFADGTLGESKAVDASDYRPKGDRRVFEIGQQISGWNSRIDLEGRTVNIYVKQTPKSDGVEEAIESVVSDRTGAEITITFKDVPEV